MSEHFHSLLAAQIPGLAPSYRIKAADLLFEMGQQLLQNGQNDLTVKWLGRARTMIEEAAKDSYTISDAQDLRLSILHTNGDS